MTGPFFERKGQGATVEGPALGLIETSSVARGIVVADAMVKKAPVRLVLARTISPGKHLVLVTGPVADVGEAMKIGFDVAAHTFVDRLELAQVAQPLLDAVGGKVMRPARSVGIFETFSVSSALLAADAACKAAEVGICILRLGDGLGGKAYFVLDGEQSDVEAALAAAEGVTATGMMLERQLIPNPHDDLIAAL